MSNIQVLKYTDLTYNDRVRHLNEKAIETIEQNLKKVLGDIRPMYPHVKMWFENKICPSLKAGDGKREILFIVIKKHGNNNISYPVGFAILKNTIKQKKICTFFIKPEFQRQGLGTILMKSCFGYLRTNQPMITVSRDNVSDKIDGGFFISFRNFLSKKFPHNFVLSQRLKNYYVEGRTEYVYNGILPIENSLIFKRYLKILE